jgi:hypothetical protein
MDEKLNKQLQRIAKALDNKGCFTMAKKVQEAIQKIAKQEKEIDSLCREKIRRQRYGA